jgi:hypothetical protein
MRLAKQTACARGEAVRTGADGRANHAVAVGAAWPQTRGAPVKRTEFPRTEIRLSSPL